VSCCAAGSYPVTTTKNEDDLHVKLCESCWSATPHYQTQNWGWSDTNNEDDFNSCQIYFKSLDSFNVSKCIRYAYVELLFHCDKLVALAFSSDERSCILIC
jgi:hypothetical protein